MDERGRIKKTEKELCRNENRDKYTEIIDLPYFPLKNIKTTDKFLGGTIDVQSVLRGTQSLCATLTYAILSNFLIQVFDNIAHLTFHLCPSAAGPLVTKRSHTPGLIGLRHSVLNKTCDPIIPL